MTTDAVNLKDDGDADFTIVDGENNSVTYDEVREYVRDYGDAEANRKFTYKCTKCGSSHCEVDDGIRMGSSWTGLYGEMDLACLDCEAYRILQDS